MCEGERNNVYVWFINLRKLKIFENVLKNVILYLKIKFYVL